MTPKTSPPEADVPEALGGEDVPASFLVRVWRYKLYPNKAQIESLELQLETQRHLYNAVLARRKEVYETTGKTLTRLDLQREFITEGRKKTEFMAQCPYGVSQQTLIRLDRTFQNFWREIKRFKAGQRADPPGFPKFRKLGEFTTLAYNSIGQGCKFNGKKVYLLGIGDVKCKYYREIPEDATIQTLSVTKQADGWFVNLTLHLPPPETRNASPDGPRQEEARPTLALLTGMEPLLFTSEGEALPSPMCYRTAEAGLIKAQQRVSRRTKGSNRRRKAVRLLARHHHHIKRQRAEWQRLIAARLTASYGVLVHEDFHPSKVIGRPAPHEDPSQPGHFFHNEALARSEIHKAFLDNAWSQFFACLRDAAVWRGTQIVAVPPFTPGQVCHACGVADLRLLEDRPGFVRCASCGVVRPAVDNNLANLLAVGGAR